MATYQITNQTSGMEMGFFEAADANAAVRAMRSDAGYADGELPWGVADDVDALHVREVTHSWREGDRVEGGDTAEDYDVGRVIAVDGESVEVAWDGSLERTWASSCFLRAEGERPMEINPTPDAIRDLRREAVAAGDDAQVRLCDQALAGDVMAIHECADAMAEAQAAGAA